MEFKMTLDYTLENSYRAVIRWTEKNPRLEQKDKDGNVVREIELTANELTAAFAKRIDRLKTDGEPLVLLDSNSTLQSLYLDKVVSFSLSAKEVGEDE
ncbi:hypothetical protein SAMN05446037_100650 [Anaerovirgula multivorans]|uniref:Uncharacterized protein n=1 Tax=Anaerovirgula multivorans TaxID=312168 RepID=A0A239CM38_9FIRM|nr:hypothetical protein [Anaerovirgula multivorans]SNS21306.1 hypothetical protein SAMN05446037_100650 [Anaerovirgula multivorans]